MFDNRLQILRTEKGYSMKQMAAALNIPYMTYVHYEKNEREPNSELLVLIAKYFNVSTDYLLGRSLLRTSNTDISTNLKLTEHEKKILNAYRSQPRMRPAVDRLLGIDSETDTVEYITGQAVAKGGKSRKLKISPENMADVHRIHEEEVKAKMKK